MLTNASIRNLKPKTSAYRVFEKSNDATLRGFGLKVLPSGTKQFFVQYKDGGGKVRFFKLGDYPSPGLQEARERCREARKLLEGGVDPRMEQNRRRKAEEDERKRIEKEAEQRRAAATVSDLLDAYLGSLDNPRTKTDARQSFSKNVLPFLGEKKAAEITREDIDDLLEQVRARGAVSVERNLYLYLRAAWEYGNRKRAFNGKILSLVGNPVAQIDKPAPSTGGQRTLTDNDIRTFWLGLDGAGMEPGTRVALLLLLLTGQRVEEILHARWAELDGERGVLDIPPDRIKTGKSTRRGHVLPLPGLAIELISSLPALGPYLFPMRDDVNRPMPFRSLSQAVRRWCAKHGDVERFSPRDIRRTVKTGMSRIGVLKEIRDRVQNHALHDVASKHYDRFDYLDDKHAALVGWEWEIRRILANRPPSDEWRKWLARFVREPYNDSPGEELKRLLSTT